MTSNIHHTTETKWARIGAALAGVSLASLVAVGCSPTTQAEDAPTPTNISVELLGKNDVAPDEFKRICADGLGFLVTYQTHDAYQRPAAGLSMVRVPEWDVKCGGGQK